MRAPAAVGWLFAPVELFLPFGLGRATRLCLVTPHLGLDLGFETCFCLLVPHLGLGFATRFCLGVGLDLDV